VLSGPEFLKEVRCMLLVGVDWAESEHAACLLDAAGAVLRRLKVPHTVAGLRRLASFKGAGGFRRSQVQAARLGELHSSWSAASSWWSAASRWDGN
jgi:hypothetical protein